VPEKAHYTSFTPRHVFLGVMPLNTSAEFGKLRNEVAAFAKWENAARSSRVLVVGPSELVETKRGEGLPEDRISQNSQKQY
jgi:hypothetical protein